MSEKYNRDQAYSWKFFGANAFEWICGLISFWVLCFLSSPQKMPYILIVSFLVTFVLAFYRIKYKESRTCKEVLSDTRISLAKQSTDEKIATGKKSITKEVTGILILLVVTFLLLVIFVYITTILLNH